MFYTTVVPHNDDYLKMSKIDEQSAVAELKQLIEFIENSECVGVETMTGIHVYISADQSTIEITETDRQHYQREYAK